MTHEYMPVVTRAWSFFLLSIIVWLKWLPQVHMARLRTDWNRNQKIISVDQKIHNAGKKLRNIAEEMLTVDLFRIR
jgi:hypothetical protein